MLLANSSFKDGACFTAGHVIHSRCTLSPEFIATLIHLKNSGSCIEHSTAAMGMQTVGKHKILRQKMLGKAHHNLPAGYSAPTLFKK